MREEDVDPVELLIAEIEEEISDRIDKGERVTADEYVRKYPEFKEEIEGAIELLYDLRAALGPSTPESERAGKALIGFLEVDGWIAARFLRGRAVTVEEALKHFELPDDPDIREYVERVIRICSRMLRKDQD